MITKESIEKRGRRLEADLRQARQILLQAQANLNAMEGAIADCAYWLSAIAEEEAKAKATQQPVAPQLNGGEAHAEAGV